MYFSSNNLKFCIFIYYAYGTFEYNSKNIFSFISFEQSMIKKIKNSKFDIEKNWCDYYIFKF
jgi:hypothetical protein